MWAPVVLSATEVRTGDVLLAEDWIEFGEVVGSDDGTLTVLPIASTAPVEFQLDASDDVAVFREAR